MYRHSKHPCKSKTKRLKKKREIRHNRNLLRKYPWLRAVDCYWNSIDTDEFTILDDMPRGWRRCFGMLLVKDIDKARAGRPITSQQVKEKYGRLEWYCSAPQEVQDVIAAYSHISQNVCINCGQVDVGHTYGWISPVCKRCFDKCCEGNYYEEISLHTRMPLEYSYRRANPETKRWEKYTVDISEYTNKVRKQWYKKHRSI